MSAASAAQNGISAYARHVGSPIRGRSKAGCAPEKSVDDKGADDGREKHRPEQAAVEILQDFFEDEGHGGEWGIERGGQSRRRASRRRRSLILFRHAQPSGNGGRHVSAELDAGAFAPEAHAAADSQAARDEFHPRDPRGRVAEVFPEGELELRDAASGGLRTKPRQQKAGDDRNRGDDREADPRKPLRRLFGRTDES